MAKIIGKFKAIRVEDSTVTLAPFEKGNEGLSIIYDKLTPKVVKASEDSDVVENDFVSFDGDFEATIEELLATVKSANQTFHIPIAKLEE